MIDFYKPKEHYSMVSSWWEARGWPIIPESSLPPIGAISRRNGRPIASGWLYKTEGADLGWIEWIISNPESSKEERSESIPELLQFLCNYAKLEDIRVVFTAVSHPSLAQHLESIGFSKTEGEMSHYTIDLGAR